jgi:hypothetical protein
MVELFFVSRDLRNRVYHVALNLLDVIFNTLYVADEMNYIVFR